jgi:hypothetical protein
MSSGFNRCKFPFDDISKDQDSFIQALLRETVSFVAFWCSSVSVQQSFSFLS